MQNAEIAVIGEALLELSGSPMGTLSQSIGGDSLNTAVYLARLTRDTATVKFVSALGEDELSAAMLDRCQAEGIDLALVLRDPARLPGLYQIRVDAQGERSFFYWRQNSAARFFIEHEDFDLVRQGLAKSDLIYLSGISLAILSAPHRAEMIALLTELARAGVDIALDSNYRPTLWSSVEAAQSSIAALLPSTRFLFGTFDDEQALWGDTTPAATVARYRTANVPCFVLKLGSSGCLYSGGSLIKRMPASVTPKVLDTTAAGDSFNAAFLAAWLAGCEPEVCCRAANCLASIVIQHRGAVIPAAATPTLGELLHPSPKTEEADSET